MTKMGLECSHHYAHWTEYITGRIVRSPNRTVGNGSVDVLRKNCLTDFDTVACARSTVLSFLSYVTAVLCLARLVRFHMLRSGQINHHMVIFYIAFVHSLLGTVEWFVGWTTQASLACLYMRSLEIVVVCHFYLTLTSRVMRCQEEPAARKIVLCLSMLFVYFTSFVAVGLVYAQTPWLDCFAPYWLYITGGHLITVQMLVVTSVLLCRKINSVSIQDSLRKAQRRDLWCLILGFEISAAVSLIYYICMFILANGDIGCSGVFHHKQWTYTSVKIPLEIITYLLPIWVILWVFRPTAMLETRCQSGVTSVTSMNDGSLMDPTLVPSPAVRNWRRSYRPLNAHLLLPGSEYDTIPYRRLIYRPIGRPRWGVLRRSRSAPSLGSRRRGSKQQQVPSTSSTIFSPGSLAPIPEAEREETSRSSLESSTQESTPQYHQHA